MAYISPEIGIQLRRAVVQGQKRMEERRDAIRQRWDERPTVDEGPMDALACPRCLALYEMGSHCPSCDVELVPEGMGDLSVPPPPPRRMVGRILVSLGLLFGSIGLYAWLATM